MSFVCAGALCEIVNPEDGSMSRGPQLLAFAKQHGLKCITIADLVRHRLQHDIPLQQQGSAINGSSHKGALH